ncbi:hypothetical protein CDAR_570941 [Caerostris darwini]|uniref:Uncharacterized protein n=1 Tax=Caerostris darwini TaxID=1538125 RepID=A0AAV4P896_9ARAC|nr:hypothetical protein CDAR_570941 [Caerostris darwini]
MLTGQSDNAKRLKRRNLYGVALNGMMVLGTELLRIMLCSQIRLTTYETCITSKLSSEVFSPNRKDPPCRKNLLCFFIPCGERHFSITLKWASICDGRRGDPVIIHQRLIGHFAGSGFGEFIHSGFGEKKEGF